MTDEISRQLGEIAELLRRRIEVAERAQKLQEVEQQEYRKSREQAIERLGEMPKLEMLSYKIRTSTRSTGNRCAVSKSVAKRTGATGRRFTAAWSRPWIAKIASWSGSPPRWRRETEARL